MTVRIEENYDRLGENPGGANDTLLDWSKDERRRHVVCVLGHSSTRQAFLVKDSRGNTIGRDGCWWLPERLADGGFVEDAYAITVALRI